MEQEQAQSHTAGAGASVVGVADSGDNRSKEQRGSGRKQVEEQVFIVCATRGKGVARGWSKQPAREELAPEDLGSHVI